MAGSILLIDDDVDALRSLGEHLSGSGFEVVRELDVAEGLATFDRIRPDLVLLGLLAPAGDGHGALEQLLQREALVILMVASDQVAAAVEAVRAGAESFVVRPAKPEHLGALCGRAAEKSRLRQINRRQLARATDPGLEAFGTSAAAKDLAHQVDLLAQNDRTTVLLQGEPGTGKTSIARLIHRLSRRGSQPFLQARCARSADELDTLLFGDERSSGSGGSERKRGLVEMAEGGTLLLEDVSSMPAELQPKLLKFLETKTYRREGGARELESDVRLIAAANGDLQAAVDSGSLREDLYYRLSVMPLALRPVREYPKEDLMALINSTLAEVRGEVASPPDSLSADAIERMVSYDWPGNIREVRNVIERCMILARGEQEVTVQHLPGEMRARYGLGDRRHTPQTLEELERQHIERTLRHHEGNRTRASQELGISRATLINKIKRYNIKL